MIRNSNPLLVAVLVAVAGCKLSTGEYAPKTDADCGPGEKACGYRCVVNDDPATGCGNVGCEPCPALGPHATAACDAALSCAYSCEAGWGDCKNGGADGCETPLDTADDCGACGRSCPTRTCNTDRTCLPEGFQAAGEPRGITASGGSIYWADDGGGGEVMQFQPVTEATSMTTTVATGLDALPGSRAFGWVAATSANVYATGSDVSAGLVVWQVSLTNSTVLPWALYSDPVAPLTTGFEGLTALAFPAASGAPAGERVVFTRDDPTRTSWWGPISVTTLGAKDGSPTAADIDRAVRGVTFVGPDVYYGYHESTGTSRASRVRADGTIIGSEDLVALGLAATPDRMAIWTDPADSTLWAAFWASEDDGSVWWAPPPDHVPTLLDAGGGGPTHMDLVAAGPDVVWSDSAAGKVTRWRWDGRSWTGLRLANGARPWGLAVLGNFVYWTDQTAWPGPTWYVCRVPR